MAQRNVRVDIPITSPNDMETLTDAVLLRHATLGAGSPLAGEVDMVLLASKHSINVTKRQDSRDAQADSEADMLLANTAMGTAAGQYIDIPLGTAYNLVGKTRDRLLFVNEGQEEELERWGFNVVIGQTAGERTVRVDIPVTNSQEMEKLVAKILAKHAALGAGSPLINQVNTALLSTQITTAKNKRKDAQSEHGNAQALMQKADIALGIEEGQTIKTPGTVYNLIAKTRDRLLFVHQGEEEQLSTYGFNVVITEGEVNSKPPTGTFTATPPSVASGEKSTLAWDIQNSESRSIDQGIGAVAESGQQQVTPAQTTTFTLKAVAPDESTLTISAPVSVTDVPPPPPA